MDIGHILADMMSDPPHGPEVPDDGTTEGALRAMLTENTGSHVLDSGGAYGRAWQRNRENHPADGSDAWLEAHVYTHGEEPSLEMWPTFSLYHYLLDRVEYDERRTRAFWDWCDAHDESRCGNYGPAAHVEDIGRNVISSFYTYNEENSLSQDFCGTVFSQDDDDNEYGDMIYVIISIHNGADARGGFTDGRVFRITTSEWTGLADWNYGSVYCDGVNPLAGQLAMDGTEEPAECGAYWDARDDWRGETSHGRRDISPIFDYPCREAETDDDAGEIGTVVVVDSRTVTCPVCGNGRLHAQMPYTD